MNGLWHFLAHIIYPSIKYDAKIKLQEEYGMGDCGTDFADRVMELAKIDTLRQLKDDISKVYFKCEIPQNKARVKAVNQILRSVEKYLWDKIKELEAK